MISLQLMNIFGVCNLGRNALCTCSRGTPSSSGDGSLVTRANWQASAGINDRPGRRSPRRTLPKRICRDVTAGVLQGGQLDFSAMEIPDFPVPDSQESAFSFAAASTSQDVPSAADSKLWREVTQSIGVDGWVATQELTQPVVIRALEHGYRRSEHRIFGIPSRIRCAMLARFASSDAPRLSNTRHMQRHLNTNL